MISRVRGTLLSRGVDRVEIATAGGVVYEITVPLSVLQDLPAPPKDDFELITLQVVREDSVTLYGFLRPGERELFRRLMSAKGVGSALAVAMLSTYAAPRLARALVERDVEALKQVSGVGKKKADFLVLALADRVVDLAVGESRGEGTQEGHAAQEAVSALVALGYSFAEADAAVRRAIGEDGSSSADDLIRKALGNR